MAAAIAGLAVITITSSCTSSDESVDGLKPVKQFTLLTKSAAQDPIRYQESKLIVQTWQKAGIPVQLEAVSPATLTSRAYTSKNFDVYQVNYDPSEQRLDPDYFLSIFTKGNAGASGSNLSGFSDPAFEAAYRAQLSASSATERQSAVKTAQEILNGRVPASVYIYPAIAGAYLESEWSGFTPNTASPVYNYWNLTGLQPTTKNTTLVVGITDEAKSLNPVAADSIEEQLPISLIYDTLMRTDPNGDPKPSAAATVKAAGNKISVTLRSSSKFHDGTPLTARDVKFSFDYLAKYEAPLYSALLSPISKVRVDGDSVVIVLKHPDSAFASTTLTQIPILPQHIWSKVKDPTHFANANPVGSGPFEFTARQPGQQLLLARYASYFKPAGPTDISFDVYGSLDGAIAALKGGEIDMLGQLTTPDALKAGDATGNVKVVTAPSIGWHGVFYNNRRFPFTDVHFRRILNALVPRKLINEVVYNGDAKLGQGVIAPTSPWVDDAIEADEPKSPSWAATALKKAGYVQKGGRLYAPAK